MLNHRKKSADGAEAGTRTPKPLRAQAPEACVFANFTTSALGQDDEVLRKRAPHYHRFSASVNTRCRLGAPALLTLALAGLMLVHGRAVAAEPPRTALHAFVALGDIEDYHVPNARYDLLIVSPGEPIGAALARARSAYPGAMVLGYLNTMDMNELVPGARDALRAHEEWFLHDATGQRVRVRIDRYKGERSRFGMNVGVAGYQDFLAVRAIDILKAGYDGVHLDNVETDSSYHVDRVGNWISGMPVELAREEWPAAEQSMLRRLRSRVSDAGLGSRPLIINHIRSAEPAVSRQYLAEVEGANTEGWLSRDRPYDGPFGWKAAVDQAAEVAQSGKLLTLICKTESVTTEESLYLFSSYLLATDGKHLYFFHGSSYRPKATEWRDFYDIDIGSPAEAMRRIEGLYVRTFSRGMVAVNPFEAAAILRLPEGYRNLAGESVRSVSVGSRSGVILTHSEAPSR